MENYDFSTTTSIVDIGGGNGGISITLKNIFPELEVVLTDSETVISHLASDIHFQESSIVLEACNFFESVPFISDKALLSNILHDWDDERCAEILKILKDNSAASNKILIMEYLVPEDSSFNVSKLLDIEMMVMGSGKERTLSEYENLFAQCKFKISNLIKTKSGLSIIEISHS